jgi:tyrosyl-tRNA synthetase
VDSSKTLYPLMQAADLIYMDVDVAYAGLDQRRAHMPGPGGRGEDGGQEGRGRAHATAPGLKGGSHGPGNSKMSKSDPDGSILIHDSPEDIKRKMSKAFCPPEAEGNPVLAICRYVLFERLTPSVSSAREVRWEPRVQQL